MAGGLSAITQPTREHEIKYDGARACDSEEGHKLEGRPSDFGLFLIEAFCVFRLGQVWFYTDGGTGDT